LGREKRKRKVEIKIRALSTRIRVKKKRELWQRRPAEKDIHFIRRVNSKLPLGKYLAEISQSTQMPKQPQNPKGNIF